MSSSRSPLAEVMARAADLRDEGCGRVVSFSRNVFLPLTNLCRDHCGYCTFRRDPGDEGAGIMSPAQVLATARKAEANACAEAMFSLGDRPEASFDLMRRFLAEHGHRTTLEYLEAMCRRVLGESRMIPHSNAGLLTGAALRKLRECNGSLGLMLENVSDRLMSPGLPHHRAPDKLPRRRLRVIEEAGRLGVPFTTGLLFGIGETIAERVDTLLAIRALHRRFGHLQEVIVQNFRAKPGTPMAEHAEPGFEDVLRTAAVARLALGGEVNLQVPPNLSGTSYPELLDAGVNDWGGVSPLTPDWINPEAPWPHLDALRRETEARGFILRERLAVYPAFLDRAASASKLLDRRLRELAGADGFRRGAP